MKVGILGGGQLARMLAQEAARMGVDVHVLCGQSDDPAAQICTRTTLGLLDRLEDVRSFSRNVDLVTIESEFLDTALVEQGLGGTAFEPGLKILARLQDRLTQKQLLSEFSIPTAPFVAWNGEADASELSRQFRSGFVLKKRRFGYDGYGTFVFRKGSSPQVERDPHGYIAEAFVPFRRELAFSLARNGDGQFAVFPLVETKQVNSRCLWVKGPVRHAGFANLLKRFQKMLEALDYRGILAAELFETKAGLTVNELAPRVHNSAHYSLDALSMSQFEAHWRGVLNWPLKNPSLMSKGFAMMNLLGEKPGQAVKLSRAPLGKLHWYGKKEIRPGRKMGHLNTVGRSPDEALRVALKWRKGFQL